MENTDDIVDVEEAVRKSTIGWGPPGKDKRAEGNI